MRIKSSKGTAKKRRAESKILHMVRMHDVARDGHCRVLQDRHARALLMPEDPRWYCEGPSELAHLEGERRFKTRGRSPELRHTTAGSAMLCRFHHQQYDARTLRVELLSNAGADGDLRWTLTSNGQERRNSAARDRESVTPPARGESTGGTI